MNANALLDKVFHLKENGSWIGRECGAGVVTFMAMAYIIFVQPAILTMKVDDIASGMDYDALITCVCLVAALGCFLMGFIANFPIALAPGMGENFFFVISVIPF